MLIFDVKKLELTIKKRTKVILQKKKKLKIRKAQHMLYNTIKLDTACPLVILCSTLCKTKKKKNVSKRCASKKMKFQVRLKQYPQ